MISASDRTTPEQLLWKRAGWGIALGMAVFTVLGFVLVSPGLSEAPLAGRIGIAVFIGFWSGPFFGSAAAVGYHELTLANQRRPAPVASVTDISPASEPAPIARRAA